jgi:ATP-dependent helicase/DNAse subunit B
MAEHVRHELARSGFPVRPSHILTLAQFLDLLPLSPGATTPLLDFLTGDALELLRPARFAALAGFRGFRAALVSLLEEIPPDALASEAAALGTAGEDLARVLRDVAANVARRGFALRNTRLRIAAAQIRNGGWTPPAHLVFDGFFTLGPAELALIEALASRATVTVALPKFPGSKAAEQRLAAAGFAVDRFTQVRRSPRRLSFSAGAPEREAEEIARRILDYSAKGRPFREMGIALRARDPYAPAIEAVLARFGIPARSYFTDPLPAHPAIAYLSGIVNGVLEGWDYGTLARLVRMPVSGLGATPAGDRLDFRLRERMTDTGLPVPGLKEAPPLLDRFAAMERWRRERLEPSAWADRLRTLCKLLPEPAVSDGAERNQVWVWRSTAAGVRAFEESIDDTAVVLSGTGSSSAGTIPLAEFWQHAATALALKPLRVEDRRRDVVHVMDVFEARQWELPVVFVPGLLERDFPQYAREDPLLGDAARRSLGLATAESRQAEERFLFDLAVTRATEEVVLSYSRFDEKGEKTLPSFFLDGEEAPPCDARVQPAPVRTVTMPPPAPLSDVMLNGQLASLHKTLSPTGIESFLQCPFQFFAGKTLHLRQRPSEPRDRLDLLVQGGILHRALAEWTRAPLLGSALLDRIFEDECIQKRIPFTYRTEAVRLELLRDFEAFLENRQVDLGWSARVEEPVRFALNETIDIQGRIDRLEVGPHNQALVIDFKYSAGNKVRERVEDSEAGNLVQGGLYLLAAERALGLEPAGMLYCGLKKGITWGGWHTSLPGLERVAGLNACTREALRELIDTAAAKAAEAYEAITAGKVAAQPADRTKCEWCDYHDICRVETAAAQENAGRGAGGA